MISKTDSLKDKVCVVTGGTGFIGSHLCVKLHNIGARVVNVDIESGDFGTLFSILAEGRNIPVIQADLAEPKSIQRIVELKPDIIFHLAGKPYAPYTTTHPITTFRSNVVSTMNMLDAARQSDSGRFVLASSACYFGATQVSPLLEDTQVSQPEHYYSYTKRQAEEITKSYSDFYGVPSIVCRFVNVYGPGDRHMGRIVPNLCKQLISEKSETLELFRSDGKSILGFLFVEDAVNALIAAAEQSEHCYELFHFGPGTSTPMLVSDLAQKLSLLYDAKIRDLKINTMNPEKKVNKNLDITRTINRIDWKASWNRDDGLARTIAWYRENLLKITPHCYEKEVNSISL